MSTARRFSATDRVTDLVMEDYNILPVLSRFSLPLGFDNKTIGQLCGEAGIDTEGFLLIINFLMSGRIDELPAGMSPMVIVDFLRNSHDYFITYKFPHIRANLIAALDESHSDINPIIVKFYDDYIAQVRKHFAYEEETVFPYIEALTSGRSSEYNIDIFRRHHDEVGDRLAELKNIILRYYATSMPYRMYDALVDIFNCEEDLESHADIENHILIPLIASMERRNDTHNHAKI
ncbi:MAG: hemerythrin domain-containing protein [Duncaniella sp.]|nr:hemerythrin domain-containing protein [Duncaniella sp.]